MAIRPLAVSVVLAAALVGTNVMHDGGAAVLDGPIGSAAALGVTRGGRAQRGADARGVRRPGTRADADAATGHLVGHHDPAARHRRGRRSGPGITGPGRPRSSR